MGVPSFSDCPVPAAYVQAQCLGRSAMSNATECPYCLNAIEDADSTVVCESCGAAHHVGCWTENGGCCVRDCDAVSRCVEIEVEAGEEASSGLVLTRESVESAKPHGTPKKLNPCIKCGRQVPEGELHCPNCAPLPEESQDIKNTGPILLMLAIVGVVLAWILVMTVGPGLVGPSAPEKPPINVQTSE